LLTRAFLRGIKLLNRMKVNKSNSLVESKNYLRLKEIHQLVLAQPVVQ
jgi:hypothetical protein